MLEFRHILHPETQVPGHLGIHALYPIILSLNTSYQKLPNYVGVMVWTESLYLLKIPMLYGGGGFCQARAYMVWVSCWCQRREHLGFLLSLHRCGTWKLSAGEHQTWSQILYYRCFNHLLTFPLESIFSLAFFFTPGLSLFLFLLLGIHKPLKCG